MKSIEPRSRSLASGIRPWLAYLLLPNLAFWVGSQLFDTLPRANVNIDYLLVGVFAPYVGFWGGVSAMSIVVLADVFRCSGSLYYFSQSEAFGSLAFLGELSPARVATIASVTLILTIGWSCALVLLGETGFQRKVRTAWMVASILVFTSLGVWGGSSSLRLGDRTAKANLATSAGLSMLKTTWGALTRKHDRLEAVPVDSATRRAGWLQRPPVDRNVVLVLVESWGYPRDASWEDAVTAPMKEAAVTEHYSVETGTIPFHGPTVPAEFRELCGLSSGVIERPTDDEARMSQCLPFRFTQLGSQATLLHGYDGHMFDRMTWSPRLGFGRTLFRRDLLAMGIRKCDGPFAGACDVDVARWIGDQLAANPEKHQFIYLLTLNSHLPVLKPEGSTNPLGCGTVQQVGSDESICNLLTLVRQVQQVVAVMASRPDLPSTEFLLVGDHAPPFLYKPRRERFSQTKVPYIHLVPKSRPTETHR